MNHETLQIAWYLLVGVLLIGYAILDGFDLGVGMMLLFAKGDTNRRVLLNSIGPVWDGNEVWLVTGGGALFAAFPDVYATVFSGFYLPLILLLMGLIFRAVAIEFRSKEPSPKWRQSWDVSFSVASLVIALLMGVALGNIVVGIPLDQHFEYTGGFFNLLNPYALLVGLTTVTLFAMHGCIYLMMKTQGELQEQVKVWGKNATIAFFVMYALVTGGTFLWAPHMANKIMENPILVVLPVIAILAILNVPRMMVKGKEALGFVSSCVSIAALMGLFGLGIFPNLVPSNIDPKNSLTVTNASASEATLTIMFTIALIGMPFVIVYTAAIYRVFRGKVVETALHY